MAETAARLYTQLVGVGIPVVGISFTRLDDKATWTVDYDPSATGPQRTQGAAIVAAYSEPGATIADEDATRRINDKALQAALIALWEAIPSPTMTKAQVKARAIAIYKTL